VSSALRETPTVQYNYEDYVMELKGRLQSSHEVDRQKLLASKERSKAHHDKDSELPDIRVGKKILIFDETVRRGRSKKLSPQYVGPYEVLAVEGVNVIIKGEFHTQNTRQQIRPFH
jgi:hypothetical protein